MHTFLKIITATTMAALPALASAQQYPDSDHFEHLVREFAANYRFGGEDSHGQVRSHIQASIPDGMRVVTSSIKGGHALVCYKVNEKFLGEKVDDLLLEELAHQMEDWAIELSSVKSIGIQFTPNSINECRSASSYLMIPSEDNNLTQPDVFATSTRSRNVYVKEQGEESGMSDGKMDSRLRPGSNVAHSAGALDGASIFLSPGHGWYYNENLGRYATQRGNTHNLIEDFSNAEAVLHYLVPYLENAGARVYTTRERDFNTNMVVLDDSSEGVEFRGPWQIVNDDRFYNGQHHEAITSEDEVTASVRYTPEIPEDGYYSVYLWYGRVLQGETHDNAKILINHSGGTAEWYQDQDKDGNTWKYVGTYYFESGRDAVLGSVEIVNSGGSGAESVVADAVRFGGGMGDIADPDAGYVSGYPRWQESGKYYAGYLGKSDWARFNTVNAMPRWAAWENEGWELGKSIYLAWHTNAPEGPVGTSSYAYSSEGFNGPFNGVQGGLALRNLIHRELINDFRAGWNPNWSDRGTHTNWFGEANPANNPEMPSAIFEVAYHATESDAQALKDPKFRNTAARAMYQGVVKYYAQHMEGFDNDTLLPEPPRNLRVTRNEEGRVFVSWDAPLFNDGDGLLGDAAEAYKVYTSRNGKGFDAGTAVRGNRFELSQIDLVEPLYVRVTATNRGGESFPTETLAAKSGSATYKVLIVNGFDRIEASQSLLLDDEFDAAALHSGDLRKMNSFDYVIEHIKALSTIDADVDSASNEAIANGDVVLGNYGAVIWMLGEESTNDQSVSAREQELIREYLENHGNLFISGSEIAWDLNRGSADDRSFLNDYLKALYVGDDAESYSVSGNVGTVFEEFRFALDDGAVRYDVNYPDILSAARGSQAVLTYSTGGVAGVFSGGEDDGSSVIYLGFPFESIIGANVRSEFMEAAFGLFCTGSLRCEYADDGADLSVDLIGDSGKSLEQPDGTYDIGYRVVIHNEGEASARTVVLENTIASGSTVIMLRSDYGECNSLTMRCHFDELGAGDSIEVRVLVNRSDSSEGLFSAHVSSVTPDPDVSNNTVQKKFGGAVGLLLLLIVGIAGLIRRSLNKK